MSIEGSAPSGRYVALDALRGGAAFAVLFYHSAPHSPAMAGSPLRFASGYLAVDLFFVLSGFVISHAYGRRLQSGFTFRAFMTARFVRLQPAIAVGTLLGFFLAVWQRTMDLEGAPGYFEIATALPVNLLMVPDVFVPWGIFLFNPPAWSLFYELLANAAYGLRARPNLKPPLRFRSNVVLATLGGLGWCGLVASIFEAGNLDHGVVLQDWPVALARIGFCFPLGMLIQHTRGSWMRHIPVVPLPALLAASLILLSMDFSGPGRMAYDLCFATLCAPMLVMLATVAEPGARLASFAEWLGMISYPLYALQAPVKHVVATALPLNDGPQLAATTLATIISAWTLGRVEPQLRRRLSDILRPPARKSTNIPRAKASSSSNP